MGKVKLREVKLLVWLSYSHLIAFFQDAQAWTISHLLLSLPAAGATKET